ncbi:hypothetical protein E1176_17840 [Fulvivirga sp. RKSG066]|uniref:DUF6268 family outer membrane beta-barrel protein n=1 Tax=Fulvivirga aurantia TaxID=2529383 RepID=UPI0012BC3118|nr:DUF6268 family outer membrane beta-barrel protein [Fulvivirga aurantia]MTI22899.1 hypothetical protein [Fulvivirga aurantia]
MKYLVISLLSFVVINASAQQQATAPVDNSIVTPYRPRVAEFTISNLYEYTTHSNSKQFGNKTCEIESDTKIKARLGIPFIIKNDLLAGLQLKYDRQTFGLEFEDSYPYELYDYIQHTHFESLGARFFFQKTIGEGKTLSGVAGVEIKSDKLVWNEGTSKYFVNLNYKVQKNENVKIGGGIALAYTLGAPQIYPIFFYENRLSKKWTMDLALPKAVVMRYRASDKFFISAKTEVKGWRYAVHNEELYDHETLTLRKSDLRFGLNLEHEIHDWLWAGVDAGYSKNLRHYLAKIGDRRRDAIIDLESSNAPYVNVSLFIVPPRKIYNKR